MLTKLDFEVAGAAPRAAPTRADVACFVGAVARRPRTPLPAPVRAQLRERGWVGGPWDPGVERVEGLLQIPVVLDSWALFDALFAWEDRRLRAGAEPRVAAYLGAAVRTFFAQGGRRAVVVRTGDPWPYLGGPARAAERAGRLAALVPGAVPGSLPFDATDPRVWRGIEHVYGLSEVSHLCLPDLADLHATEPPPLEVATEAATVPEIFVECSATEPPAPTERASVRVSAPRLESDGFRGWAGTVEAARDFLAAHRRDALLLASLPLPREEAGVEGGAPARTRWLDFLRETEVLEGAGEGRAASALVQLVWPWLRTAASDDLPERLEPGEGLLAGVLATNALARGTFRSAAGTRLPRVAAVDPVPDLGLGPDSPTALLAERVCLVGPEPDGMTLLSDVTSSPDPDWRPGGVSRLMAALLRAARRTGEAELFEPNGPQTWERIRRAVEGLLEGWARAGAFRGVGRGTAYQVRCDRSTMSQNDLDYGRVRVEITVQPAPSVERITVSLELTGGRVGPTVSGVA